jgi:hypothetical protein
MQTPVGFIKLTAILVNLSTWPKIKFDYIAAGVSLGKLSCFTGWLPICKSSNQWEGKREWQKKSIKHSLVTTAMKFDQMHAINIKISKYCIVF